MSNRMLNNKDHKSRDLTTLDKMSNFKSSSVAEVKEEYEESDKGSLHRSDSRSSS